MPGCSIPKFSRSMVLTAGLLVLFASSAHEAAASDKRLFVLQEATRAIVEYGLKTGAVVKSVPVPPDVFKQDHPVIVSHRGQILISLYQPDGYAVPIRHWFWDGNNAQMLVPSVSPADDSDGWAFPRPLLSADGGNPFWYKTDMKGTGQAVQPIFQMFRGILRGSGGRPAPGLL